MTDKEVTPQTEKWYLHNLGFSPLPVVLMLIPDQIQRMSKTCFRGHGEARSGNFKFWPDMYALMRDLHMCHAIGQEVTSAVQKCISEQRKALHIRFTIQHPDLIGWQGTLPASEVDPALLERFTMNTKTDGWRIRPSSGMLAPSTNLVTLAIECRPHKKHPGVWQALVHTVYPGVNIGMLKPSSRKESCLIEHIVFFDWDHPGEEIAEKRLTTHQR